MRKQRFGAVPRAARLDHQVVPVTGWESLIAKTVLVAEQGDTAVGRDPLGCLAGAADHTGRQVGRWREASGGTRGTGPASDRGQATCCGEWKVPIWTLEEEGLSLGQQAAWDPRPKTRGEGCRCRGLRWLVWLRSDDS